MKRILENFPKFFPFFFALRVCVETTTTFVIPRDDAVLERSKREREREKENFFLAFFKNKISGVDILIGKSKRCAFEYKGREKTKKKKKKI